MTHQVQRVVTRTAGVLLAAALLTGCSATNNQEQEETSAPAQEAAEQPDVEEEADDQGDDAEASAQDHVATSLTADPADVVGEVQTILAGTDDEVTAQVLPLEVDGDIMVLRVLFTPNFASESNDAAISVSAMGMDHGLVPVLTDRENLKEYRPISDTGQQWEADKSYTKATNGEPVEWWAVFTAPEDDIDTLDVLLGHHLPVLADVPVQ